MEIWNQNITRHEKRRSKLNEHTHSKNFRTNRRQSQSELGDMTLIDRSESVMEQKRNKDLFEVTQTQEFDFGATW